MKVIKELLKALYTIQCANTQEASDLHTILSMIEQEIASMEKRNEA